MKTVLAFLLLTAPAHAHSFYPAACCHDQDCHPVGCDSLSEGPNGSVEYTPLHKVFDKMKVRPSEDSMCHVCLHGQDQAPLCVFVQQGS